MFLGYTSGVAPLFSYNYGAQNHERLQKLFRLSLLFIAVGSAAAYGASLADVYKRQVWRGPFFYGLLTGKGGFATIS